MKTSSWRRSTSSAVRRKPWWRNTAPPKPLRQRYEWWMTEGRMARLYDVITFDCYGTLIDWEGGISAAFARAAAAAGRHLDRARMLEAYAETEPGVEAAPYRRYRDVLTEAAR